MVFKNPLFFFFFFFCRQKAQNFVQFGPYSYCSNFTSVWYKHSIRNVWRYFRLLMSALAMVAGKVLAANLLQKLIFRSGISCYHCWYDIESLSIIYLISIWTTCWWNLNKIVWSELYHRKHKLVIESIIERRTKKHKSNMLVSFLVQPKLTSVP